MANVIGGGGKVVASRYDQWRTFNLVLGGRRCFGKHNSCTRASPRFYCYNLLLLSLLFCLSIYILEIDIYNKKISLTYIIHKQTCVPRYCRDTEKYHPKNFYFSLLITCSRGPCTTLIQGYPYVYAYKLHKLKTFFCSSLLTLRGSLNSTHPPRR